ncbi:MAG: DNA methyltransferase [Candidatus Thorarchaeota archaeon]|jgi:DNA modification methylase
MVVPRLSRLEQRVVETVRNALTLGTTLKQIAAAIDEDVEKVADCMQNLSSRGKVVRMGRGLWVLKQYERIENDPEFISPAEYANRFAALHNLNISEYHRGPITFSENHNMEKPIQRWAPYVQGFSASFVDEMLQRFSISPGQRVLDPFAGSGTVLVAAKMKGINAIGVDLVPLMTFMARTKTEWDLNVEEIRTAFRGLNWAQNPTIQSPTFLRMWESHFNKDVLRNLLIIKQSIQDVENPRIKNLFRLALASVLVDNSNLKRSPCLGYAKEKNVAADAPFTTFSKKIDDMIQDLMYVKGRAHGSVNVITGDSRTIRYEPESIDIAITSPPYVNGLDYIINYKIEMAWLDMVDSYDDLSKLKDDMVACDNVSRVIIRDFSEREDTYRDEWLDDITNRIFNRIESKAGYRRRDMHNVVRKYFDDVYHVFRNVYEGLKKEGRFAIVIGDSLIAGVYIPADLILARVGKSIGFKIESVEVARSRRSGQRKSFKLRESIVILLK